MAFYESEEDKKKMEEHLTKQTGGNVRIIEPTDKLDFKCQRCGQCCMGRNDIVLNPFDVYNACVALKITPREFIDKYANLTMGPTSRLPVITLKSDHRNWCHFLEFDIKNGGLFKCGINDNKPGACRNHPVGVVTSFKKDGDIEGEMHEMYIQVEQCDNSKGHNNFIPVSDWMQKTEELAEERQWSHRIQSLPSMRMDIARFFKLLAQTAQGPANIEEWSEEDRKRIEEVMQKSIDIMKFFFSAVVDCTYGMYDIDKPFVEQVQDNYKKLDEICTQVGEYYTHMEEAFLASGGSLEELDNA